MKSILLIGLQPSVVDFSSFPGLTEEKLVSALEAQRESLKRLGFDAEWCLVDHGETAEHVARAAIEARPSEVVMIGAGIRAMPAHFALFERLINIVHEHAPKARICFNTRPDDTQEAVLRWITPVEPTFRDFAGAVMQGDVPGASALLTILLGTDPVRSRAAAQHFQASITSDPTFVQKAMSMRQIVGTGTREQLTTLLAECFGLDLPAAAAATEVVWKRFRAPS